MSMMLHILAERIKKPKNEGTESRIAESLLLQMWEDLEVLLNSVSYFCLENSFEDFSNFKDYLIEGICFNSFFPLKVIKIRYK